MRQKLKFSSNKFFHSEQYIKITYYIVILTYRLLIMLKDSNQQCFFQHHLH